jgi:hypothetical protein
MRVVTLEVNGFSKKLGVKIKVQKGDSPYKPMQLLKINDLLVWEQ